MSFPLIDPVKVCAIIVTYNRKELLVESLAHLREQSRPVDRILVVDNASTDGTQDLLESSGYLAASSFEYLRLPTNEGGAGGFSAGMQKAFAADAEWFWLLDDDAMAAPESLALLLSARERFPEGQRPDLLASNVTWTDGSIHPMNVPRIKGTDYIESVILAAEHGTVAVRAASFVSLLVHRRLITRYDFPVADYFIWNDDVEYTARILRKEFGVLVPGSIVVHKTPARQAVRGPRTYYAVRNQLWMIIRSEAWTGKEKVRLLGSLATAIASYLRDGFSGRKVAVVLRGLIDGTITRPRANKRFSEADQ